MKFSRTIKNILTSTLMCVFVATTLLAPISPRGVQEAEALFGIGDSVIVTADFSAASALRNANTLMQTGFQGQNAFKENILDPLFWTLANSVITGMLTSLTQWVNSGFQGSPAFITDLEGYLRDALDTAAGQFLEDNGLEALCSPFKLDVKIALNKQYAASRPGASSGGAGTPQCTLSDVTQNMENFLSGSFTDGGWGSWLSLTQEPYNDPNKAFFEERERLRIAVNSAQENKQREAETNEYFNSVKACKDVQTANGTKKQCVNSTLGNVVQDQLNSTFDAQKQRLVFADEFDELVGALLNQFVNQAIMGINGLLGMGGSSYSDNSYDGGSYLQAVQEEAFNETVNDSDNPILDAIDAEVRYIDLLTQIVVLVDDLDEDVDAANNNPNCPAGIRMTPQLTDARDNAESEIIASNARIIILNTLNQALLAAESTEERIDIMREYADLQSNELIDTQTGIMEAELDLNYVLPDLVNAVRQRITTSTSMCGV